MEPGELHFGVARGIGGARELPQPPARLPGDAVVQCRVRSHGDAKTPDRDAEIMERLGVRPIAQTRCCGRGVVEVGSRDLRRTLGDRSHQPNDRR